MLGNAFSAMHSRNLSRAFILLLILCHVFCSVPAALAQADPSITIASISKYGNLELSISGSDFLAMGYEYGDIVTAHIGGMDYDMPIGSNYTDVDNGNPVCRVVINQQTGEDGVTIAICMGDFATAAEIASKQEIADEPGFVWNYSSGYEKPVTVVFSMKEKGGYADEYQLRQLVRTNAREDYAHLTDAEFANFRPISTTGMGKNAIFRSSSPANPELGRNSFADAALALNGVKTVINLADTMKTLESYPGYAESAYSSCNIIALNLGVDVLSESFCAGFAEGLRFLIANEGPYLIHCTEGKDRAGFASAVLECLMGASLDEVIADYMLTYYNYYGVEPGTEQYDKIADKNLCKLLSDAFEIESVREANISLNAEAVQYLVEKLGLTEDEVAAIRERLSDSI